MIKITDDGKELRKTKHNKKYNSHSRKDIRQEGGNIDNRLVYHSTQQDNIKRYGIRTNYEPDQRITGYKKNIFNHYYVPQQSIKNNVPQNIKSSLPIVVEQYNIVDINNISRSDKEFLRIRLNGFEHRQDCHISNRNYTFFRKQDHIHNEQISGLNRPLVKSLNAYRIICSNCKNIVDLDTNIYI